MGNSDSLISGETIDFTTEVNAMDENSFQALLDGKSSNTTIPYMLRAKELIIRGLLTRGSDAKSLNDNQELIG
ncbi:MAG: hypothetical protein PHU01_15225 [Desulfuromonadaceae bacterium]|nr:hypothetical protein [Desulfuromonadaceae bacterium]